MGIKSRLLKFKPNSLEQTFREMAQRFAVPFFCSLVLTAVFLCHVRFGNNNGSAFDINDQAWWYNYFISLIPSFFTTVATSLIFENYAPQKPAWFKHLSNFCVVMALALYTHYMLPFNADENIATFVQLGLWCFACVFVAHHYYKHDNLVFWHNTKNILMAVLLAMLLSFVVLLGSACVFGAIDALFGTKIIEPMMFIVAFVVIFLGAPSLVMAQLPQASAQPIALTLQPAGIVTKALVVIQWLLTAVLLAYAAHILVGWQLPKGRVVYQVGSYAVGGLLVYFLAYHAQATKFVANYIHHWPKVLLALALLPTMAIWQRIAAHGITPNRLLVVYLLVAIASFGIITLWPKLTNKRLPLAAISLLAITFLALFSPLNAQRVARAYFDYDSSKAIAERLGHENIISFILHGDLFDGNNIVPISPYNYIIAVDLNKNNHHKIVLGPPHNLTITLQNKNPQKITITNTKTHQKVEVLLKDLLRQQPLLESNGEPYQSLAINKKSATQGHVVIIGKQKMRLLPQYAQGYYNQIKDDDFANYNQVKKLDRLEFYMLVK